MSIKRPFRSDRAEINQVEARPGGLAWVRALLGGAPQQRAQCGAAVAINELATPYDATKNGFVLANREIDAARLAMTLSTVSTRLPTGVT